MPSGSPIWLLQQIRRWLKKRTMRSSSPRPWWLLLALLLAPGLACDKKAKEEMSKRLNETNDKLLQCRKENNDLRNEVAGLKRPVVREGKQEGDRRSTR